MPRLTQPLTNTEVKQAKPKQASYKLLDGHGLQLHVKPSGTKTWVLDYCRPHTRVRTTISLGQYPALSLADARRQRESAKQLLEKDIDPKDDRDTLRLQQIVAAKNTLEAVAEQWMDVKRSKVSADYANDIWRSLELHIFPALGKQPIHKIAAVKVIEIMRPVAAKGSLETVKRLCQRLNEIMTYAVNSGLIEHNRLAGIADAFQTPTKTHHPTISPDQLPKLMTAIADANIRISTRCLILWQLHTMVRPSEAAGTRWEEIDFENNLWTIPAERMKKNLEHKVPLTPQMIDILEKMRAISGHREHAFPNERNPRKPTNAQTANMALKRMGFEKLLVAHGLRSLASTTLNEQGFDPDIIEKALAHIDKNEVRKAYNRADYIERRKPMMEIWSKHIEKAAKGNLSAGAGKKSLELAAG